MRAYDCSLPPRDSSMTAEPRDLTWSDIAEDLEATRAARERRAVFEAGSRAKWGTSPLCARRGTLQRGTGGVGRELVHSMAEPNRRRFATLLHAEALLLPRLDHG